jgi:hypothetical protein
MALAGVVVPLNATSAGDLGASKVGIVPKDMFVDTLQQIQSKQPYTLLVIEEVERVTDPTTAIRIAKQAGASLQSLHSAGHLLHCDVSFEGNS